MTTASRIYVPLLMLLLVGGLLLTRSRVGAEPVTAVAIGQAPQTEVSIVLSNPAVHPKVGLPDFVVPAGDAELAEAAKTVADVLWDDLEYEREYYMIQRKTSASIPVAPANALPNQMWRDMGADFVLVGEVKRNGGDFAVELRMMSVKGTSEGQQSWGRGYPNCKVQYVRLCAHSIADDFHKETRNLDGVARTKLAFASDRDGSRVAGRPTQTVAASKEIYVSDYDGANQSRITVNRNVNCCPAWSPSGGLLSYVSWMSGFPDIYVANIGQPGRGLGRPAGGGPTISNITPAWSPDGMRVAFASNRSGNYDIWVVNRDGTGLQNLTNSVGYEIAPTWSPNGGQIAFISDRGGTNQLYVMNASGTGVSLLIDQKVDRPTWSPLDFIAFTVETSAGHDIGIYDFTSRGVKVLTDGKGSNESPSVAPNGRHIAFFTTRWGRQHIATVDRTGSNYHQITEVGNNTYPNWQPITQ